MPTTLRVSPLVALLTLLLALGGCTRSKPPTLPLSPDTYAYSWLVVVVEPATSTGRAQQVLVYFYGRPTIYGTGAYVDVSDLIVSQEDGQVTVPLYIVSQGKERTSRDKLFPTAPRSNDLRGEIICTGWHAAAPNPSMTPAATAVDTTATLRQISLS